MPAKLYIDEIVSSNTNTSISMKNIVLDGFKLKSSGNSITKSDGTTSVLSESGGAVTLTADRLTVSGATEFQDNPVIKNGSPELTFNTTNPAHANWQIAAQENLSNAFEIASGQQDADASDDTWTKRFIVLNNGDISFYDDTGTTAEFFWDASAESLGIGTSSPNAKLDVAGSIRADSTLSASNINGSWYVGGNGQTYSANRDTKISAGGYVYGSYPGGSGSPHTYDIALQVPNGGRAMEFSANWLNSTAGPLYFRTLRDCCINWSSWSTISMSTVSDRRVKDNVVNYTAQEARNLIEKLQAVEYDYVNQDGTKGIVDEEEPDAALIPRPREIGYIAQDIIKDVPFVVGYNKNLDQENEHGWASAYTVDYERLVPVLSEALKDVYKTLDETSNKLTAAESTITNLEERLLLAESRIERIINGEL